MPNLNFYAYGADRHAVVEAAFRLGCFRIFEAYSRFDHELREFLCADEVPVEWDLFLLLYPVGAGPEPVVGRIDLMPDAVGGASFRYQCRGWGLVKLNFGNLHEERGLEGSHTNHNSAVRAAKWAGAYPALGDPVDWDFQAVARSSSRFNRAIRALAVDKIGAYVVLPAAAQLITDLRLQYVWVDSLRDHPQRT